jgi:Spy/CpxP family protein refolding chaperone
MKKSISMLAVALIMAAPLAAQGGGMAAGRGGMGMGAMTAVPNVDTLASQLSLTAEQKPKVAELVNAFATSTKGVRDWMAGLQASGGMAAMRDNPGAQDSLTKLRDARTKFAADLKGVLTQAQATKYDELYPTRPAGMGRPGGQD